MLEILLRSACRSCTSLVECSVPVSITSFLSRVNLLSNLTLKVSLMASCNCTLHLKRFIYSQFQSFSLKKNIVTSQYAWITVLTYLRFETEKPLTSAEGQMRSSSCSGVRPYVNDSGANLNPSVVKIEDLVS